MTKEIEVKAKIHDVEAVIGKLEAIGVELSEPIIQNDETFVDEEYGDYSTFQPGKNVLRIREQNGRFIFTLKQPQKNELDCIEHETEISDPHAFKEALLLMGYKSVVEIHKVRRKARYNDYEICVDEVKELGTFIEVEKKTAHDAQAVQDELFAFLVTLGIAKEDRVERGYDTLLFLSK